MAADKKTSGRSHATKLVAVVVACKAELFHCPQGEPYVTIDSRTMHLKTPEFKYWLAREFMKATRKMPSSNALNEAITGIIGSALFTGPEHAVYNRVAGFDDRVYVDLGSSVAIITPDGWEL